MKRPHSWVFSVKYLRSILYSLTQLSKGLLNKDLLNISNKHSMKNKDREDNGNLFDTFLIACSRVSQPWHSCYWYFGWIILYCGGLPHAFRMFSSIAGLYPLDAHSAPVPHHHHTHTQLWLSKISPYIAKCPLGVKIAGDWKLLSYNIRHHPILYPSYTLSHLISPFQQALKDYSLNMRIGSVTWLPRVPWVIIMRFGL